MPTKQYLANVLIVEDAKVDAALLEEMLKSFGCFVDITDGLDTSDKLYNPYDIIFMDINMPSIDGFTIADNKKLSFFFYSKQRKNLLFWYHRNPTRMISDINACRPV